MTDPKLNIKMSFIQGLKTGSLFRRKKSSLTSTTANNNNANNELVTDSEPENESCASLKGSTCELCCSQN